MQPPPAEQKAQPAEQKQPEAAVAEKVPEIDANMMADVIGDLGIDIDPNDLDGIIDEAKKDADKKDEDKEKK